MLATTVATAADPPPTAEQLSTWLVQLSDADFATRQLAFENLYASGPAAMQALEAASRGGNLETALQSQLLLDRIQSLYLVGCRVTLTAQPTTAAWHEAITLQVTIHNDHDYGVLLPFLQERRERIDAGPQAVQFGTLLDVADYPDVRDAAGAPVEMLVEDIRGVPALENALDYRVLAEPSSLLAAQASVSLEVSQFNTGLARYRLLEQGAYQVTFRYVPEWDAPALIERRVGEVTSNALTLNIREAAPAAIRAAERRLSVVPRWDGETLVVELHNTHDHALGVNLNLGLEGNIHWAQLKLLAPTAGPRAISVPFKTTGPPAAQAIRSLQPDQRLLLTRLQRPQLRELLGPATRDFSVVYLNLLDAALIRRTPPPAAQPADIQKLLEAMPVPMFNGETRSQRIALPN